MRRLRLGGATLSTTERCWSGRTGLPAKQLHGQNPCRGFESPPLRFNVISVIRGAAHFRRAIACNAALEWVRLMALKLYRRHRKECEGGHAEDACSGEFEEGRRG